MSGAEGLIPSPRRRWRGRGGRGSRSPALARCRGGQHAAGDRDTMSCRVHALDVGVVIASLGTIGAMAGRIAAGHAADHKSASGTNCGAVTAADGSTGNRTDGSAYRSTLHARLRRRLTRSGCPVEGVLPARIVVGTKLGEVLARSRQGKDGRFRRWRRTSGQKRGDGKQGRVAWVHGLSLSVLGRRVATPPDIP